MGQITVRLPEALHATLRDRASTSSMNTIIVDALTAHLDATCTRAIYADAAQLHATYADAAQRNAAWFNHHNATTPPSPPAPSASWTPSTWTITTGDVVAAVDAIRPGTPWRMREALYRPIAAAGTITTTGDTATTSAAALHAAACITTGFAREFPLADSNYPIGLACGLAILTTCGLPTHYDADMLYRLHMHLQAITASPAPFNDLVPQVHTLLAPILSPAEGSTP